MRELMNSTYGKVTLFIVILVGLMLYATFSILAEEEMPLAKAKALAVDGLLVQLAEDVEENKQLASEDEAESQEEVIVAEEEKEATLEEKDEEEGLKKENKETSKEENKVAAKKEEEKKEEVKQESQKKEAIEPPAKVEEKKENDEQAELKEEESMNQARQANLNAYVLSVMKTYPTNGSYPYLLNTDYQNYNGVTANIHFKDRLLLKAHPSGSRASHCSGLTFEVFFKAMQQRNKEAGLSEDDFNGMSYDQLYNFAMTWYVANGNKQTSNIAVAVERYGIGQEISNFENAKPGDFLDFSRENNTGHTVVFLSWIRDNGKIVGLKYWSTQGSTKGINYNQEYFNVEKSDGTKYGNVIIDQVYIARVTSINNYK